MYIACKKTYRQIKPPKKNSYFHEFYSEEEIDKFRDNLNVSDEFQKRHYLAKAAAEKDPKTGFRVIAQIAKFHFIENIFKKYKIEWLLYIDNDILINVPLIQKFPLQYYIDIFKNNYKINENEMLLLAQVFLFAFFFFFYK